MKKKKSCPAWAIKMKYKIIFGCPLLILAALGYQVTANFKVYVKSTPFKKVTQLKFYRLYFFYPGFLFIKLDIPGMPVYLPFEWCLICYDCFTGARAGWVNWGQCQKGKVTKLIGLNLLNYILYNGKCECMHAYPLPIHCIEILR